MSALGYDLITEEMFQEALARIEALETALREIATGENSFFGMMKIAREVLDKDAGK